MVLNVFDQQMFADVARKVNTDTKLKSQQVLMVRDVFTLLCVLQINTKNCVIRHTHIYKHTHNRPVDTINWGGNVRRQEMNCTQKWPSPLKIDETLELFEFTRLFKYHWLSAQMVFAHTTCAAAATVVVVAV